MFDYKNRQINASQIGKKTSPAIEICQIGSDPLFIQRPVPLLT